VLLLGYDSLHFQKVDRMTEKSAQGRSSRTPGEMLKKAREQQNLSQEEVALQLRLKLDIIQNLEADNFASFPALVYMKGYLRSYAQLLNISQDELMKAFADLKIADPIPSVVDLHKPLEKSHEEADENHWPWLRISLFALLGLLIAAALIVWLSQGKKPTKNTALMITPMNTEAQASLVSPASHLAAVEKPAEPEIAEKPAPEKIKPKHHYHRVSHHVLKPNYTLAPVTDRELN
jgi:cytoskeletal protein RodZ